MQVGGAHVEHLGEQLGDGDARLRRLAAPAGRAARLGGRRRLEQHGGAGRAGAGRPWQRLGRDHAVGRRGLAWPAAAVVARRDVAGGRAEVAVDRAVEQARDGERGDHAAAGQAGDLVDPRQVLRGGDGDHQGAVAHRDGQGAQAGGVGRQEVLGGPGVGRHGGQVGDLDVGLGGLGLDESGLVEQAEVEQRAPERGAGGLLVAHRAVEVVRGDQAVGEQVVEHGLDGHGQAPGWPDGRTLRRPRNGRPPSRFRRTA